MTDEARSPESEEPNPDAEGSSAAGGGEDDSLGDATSVRGPEDQGSNHRASSGEPDLRCFEPTRRTGMTAGEGGQRARETR